MSSNPETEAVQRQTAGQLLRQARLTAGVHLAVLSVHLKVPVKQLEALEADELDPSKGPVFYRGLTASVCRQLGIDSAPVLKLLPQLSGQLEPVKRLQLPSGAVPADFGRGQPYRQKFPSVFLWLAALLLGLTAFFVWMPSASTLKDEYLSHFSFFKEPAAEQVTQETTLPLTVIAPADNALPAENRNLPATLTATPTTDSAALAPTMSASPVTPTTKPASVELPSSSGLAQWTFTASAESWLELRNSQNSVIWSGVLNAGDIRQIESPLPVRVVVGRAQVVNATLRGQVFDLKPYMQANVARFEVKE